MKQTFVHTRRYSPKKVENYAFGYVFSDSLQKFFLPDSLEETSDVIWLDGIVGDGCVNSTINDLLKWDRALYTNKLLSRQSMKELFQAAVLNAGSPTSYGLGWEITDHETFGKTVSHGGGWPGYVSYFERHVTHDKTIIILQNHDNVTLPIKTIRNILYNIEEVNGYRPTAEQLQNFVGVYEFQAGFLIEIESQNDRLFAKTAGQPTIELNAKTENVFTVEEIGAQITFNLNEMGTVKSLTFSQGGNLMEGKKIR